jgi:hypothetical protein
LRQKRRCPAAAIPCLAACPRPVFGLAAFLSTPTITSHADMAAMLAGGDGGDARWKTILTASPAARSRPRNWTFADPILTSSTASGAGVTLPNGDKIAFQGKIGAPDPRPDAERVTRHLKKGRVIAVAPVQPAQGFFRRQRARAPVEPVASGCRSAMTAMAFLKPSIIRGKEIEIATAFYTSGERQERSPGACDAGKPGDQRQSGHSGHRLCAAGTGLCPQSPFSSVLREVPSAAASSRR